MVYASVPGVHCWGNLCHPSLSGVLRPPPSFRRDLRAPFLLGRWVTVMADHMMQRACTSPFFQCHVQGDFPANPDARLSLPHRPVCLLQETTSVWDNVEHRRRREQCEEP
jgi:hypothetical protein